MKMLLKEMLFFPKKKNKRKLSRCLIHLTTLFAN